MGKSNNETHVSITKDMHKDLKAISKRDRRTMRESLKIMIEEKK